MGSKALSASGAQQSELQPIAADPLRAAWTQSLREPLSASRSEKITADAEQPRGLVETKRDRPATRRLKLVGVRFGQLTTTELLYMPMPH